MFDLIVYLCIEEGRGHNMLDEPARRSAMVCGYAQLSSSSFSLRALVLWVAENETWQQLPQ
jgi:hypothetical protein